MPDGLLSSGDLVVSINNPYSEFSEEQGSYNIWNGRKWGVTDNAWIQRKGLSSSWPEWGTAVGSSGDGLTGPLHHTHVVCILTVWPWGPRGPLDLSPLTCIVLENRPHPGQCSWDGNFNLATVSRHLDWLRDGVPDFYSGQGTRCFLLNIQQALYI